MNIPTTGEKDYQNRSILQKIFFYAIPIGFALGLFIVWGLYSNVSLFMDPESQTAFNYRHFLLFLIVIMTISFVYQMAYIRRLLQPIHVVIQGIRIHHLISGWQLIEWKNITTIRQIEQQQSQTFFSNKNQNKLWRVETTVPKQLALTKKEKISFFITSSHEECEGLLSLLQEKSGTEITKPTKKPKVPPWKPGNAR